MAYLISFLTTCIGALMRPFRRRSKDGRVRCLLLTYCGVNNTGAEARTIEAVRQIREAAGARIVLSLVAFERANALRYFTEDEGLTIATPRHVFFVDIARLVFRSDVVILVEGSGFRENFSSPMLWYFLYALGLAQGIGLPTAAYAIDAGRLSNGNRFFASRVARKTDLMMTRTQASADRLREMGVTTEIGVHADTAFAIRGIDRSHVDTLLTAKGLPRDGPLLGFAFKEFFWYPVEINLRRFLMRDSSFKFSSCYYHTWNEQRARSSRTFKAMVASLLDRIAEDFGMRIVLIAMEQMDDGPTRDVAALLRTPSALVSAKDHDAVEMAGVLRGLNYLITTRYHALILSLAAAIPTIAVSHDDRLDGLMEEMGLKADYWFRHDGLPPEKLSAELLASFRKMVANSAAISSRMREAYSGYLERSAKNQAAFATFFNDRFAEARP